MNLAVLNRFRQSVQALTLENQARLATIIWLLDERPQARRSGRTSLMVLALAFHAISRPGTKIGFQDHIPSRNDLVKTAISIMFPGVFTFKHESFSYQSTEPSVTPFVPSSEGIRLQHEFRVRLCELISMAMSSGITKEDVMNIVDEVIVSDVMET